jgi:hypothetical protein
VRQRGAVARVLNRVSNGFRKTTDLFFQCRDFLLPIIIGITVNKIARIELSACALIYVCTIVLTAAVTTDLMLRSPRIASVVVSTTLVQIIFHGTFVNTFL